MDEKLSRKILMFYPDQSTIEDVAEREHLHMLVNSINYIVEESNRKAYRIIAENGEFLNHCFPRIELSAIEQYIKNTEFNTAGLQVKGLRICLTNIDKYDYTDLFYKSHIFSEYIENEISHIVAIKINTKRKKAVWTTDPNNKFHAVVETSLDCLSRILLSIMIDIMLYHSYSLPNDIKYRYDFAEIKKRHLISKKSEEDLKRIYGSEKERLTKLRYLPLSYAYISPDCKCKLKETLHNYSDLVINNVLYCISSTGTIIKSYKQSIYKDDDKIINDYLGYISSAISKSSIDGEEYIVKLYDNDTDKGCKPLSIDEFTKEFITRPLNSSVWFYRVKKGEV